MDRPKKIDNSIRLSVVLSKEQADWMKRMVLRMSTKEGRQISVSESIRLAIEVAYPVPKNQTDLFKSKN